MSATETISPLVSVILCTYNGEAFLRQQLDSILEQTYPNIELVISDDTSTDGTITILEEYNLKDPRIRFTVNPINIGYNKNFEKTILEAAGNYIAISDQDDIWEPEKISTMIRLWPEGAQFVYSLSGNFEGNDFKKRSSTLNVLYGPVSDLHHLVFNSPVHGHACMFKKNLVDGCMPFPDEIFYDWWLSMHAASVGIIGCIPQVLTWHRIHGHNSSRSITSIHDKMERDCQLRKQSAYFIETFYNRHINTLQQKDSLLEYARLLKKLDGKKFSGGMFRYIFKNRRLVFHYKKQKPLIYISYLKHTFRMAYSGLLLK